MSFFFFLLQKQHCAPLTLETVFCLVHPLDSLFSTFFFFLLIPWFLYVTGFIVLSRHRQREENVEVRVQSFGNPMEPWKPYKLYKTLMYLIFVCWGLECSANPVGTKLPWAFWFLLSSYQLVLGLKTAGIQAWAAQSSLEFWLASWCTQLLVPVCWLHHPNSHYWWFLWCRNRSNTVFFPNLESICNI